MSRNIIIYPNRNTTAGGSEPYISFSGASAGTINLVVEDDGGIVFDGDNGGLFSIEDNKDGLLHSVNDISGLPILQVWDNDLVIAGKWDDFGLAVNTDKVFVGGITSTTTQLDTTLYVSGGTEFDGRVKFTGGTDGYVFTSDASGYGTWQIAASGGTGGGAAYTGTTSGSVLFVDSDLSITEDGTKLFYDNTNNRLSIGSGSTEAKLQIIGDTNFEELLNIRGNGASDGIFTIGERGDFLLGRNASTTVDAASRSTWVQLGESSISVAGTGGVVIGNNATATTSNSIAIGPSSKSQGGISIGILSVSDDSSSIAIGSFATEESANSGNITIGNSSNIGGNATNGIAFGTSTSLPATATGSGMVALGSFARAYKQGDITIGYRAMDTSGSAILGTERITIGADSNGSTLDVGDKSITIGASSDNSGDQAISLGYDNTVTHSRAIVLGTSNSSIENFSFTVGRNNNRYLHVNDKGGGWIANSTTPNTDFFGINTTGATAHFQIGDASRNSTFRYVDGNEALGYVLTSDASGNATWQVAASGGTGGGGGGGIYGGSGSLSADTTITMSGNSIDFSGGQIATPPPTTHVPAGTTQTINWDDGNFQVIDLGSATGDVTLTFSNPKAGAVYTIKSIQGLTERLYVYPAAMKWESGTPLIPTNVNNGIDIITMIHDEAGNYLASYGASFS